MDTVDTRPISLEIFLAIKTGAENEGWCIIYKKGHLVFSVIVLWFPCSGLL